jgi:predicted DNA-binding transcriptional regulator AlpA
MTASQPALAAVLADLVAVGKKLTETAQSALACLETGEAECRSSPREPESSADTPMPTPSLLLTRAETRELLRMGDRTFVRLRSDRALRFPAPVRGRPLRWRRGDIEHWLAGGRR